MLLLSLAGIVVIMGFFLLADFLSPNPQVGDLARKPSVKSATTPEKRKAQPKSKSPEWWISEPHLATHQLDAEEQEELAQERAECSCFQNIETSIFPKIRPWLKD